jgi:hypothetical protein
METKGATIYNILAYSFRHTLRYSKGSYKWSNNLGKLASSKALLLEDRETLLLTLKEYFVFLIYRNDLGHN